MGPQCLEVNTTMLNDSMYSSEKMDWATPKDLFNKLNEEFSFTLDVCATIVNAKCSNFYSPKNDGLSQSWRGVVWMNPPYGRGINQWVKKAFESSQQGCKCVCLVPVRSDTRWWHDYVMKASEIRLLTRRLSFEGANNKAPFPAAIVVFDPDSTIPSLSAMVV
jgi:phage N-6-adenine-methyltransferase